MYRPSRQYLYTTNRQRGAVLAVVLMFLLLLTILGITALNTTTLEERMAGNLNDRQHALQATESALTTAERWLGSLTPDTKPSTYFTNNATGRYQIPTDGVSLWQSVDWSGSSLVVHPNVPVGAGTATALTKIASQPKYIVENLGTYKDSYAPIGYSTYGSNPNKTYYFRITARGSGATNASSVFMESVYQRPFNEE